MNSPPLSAFKDVAFTQDSIETRSALAYITVNVILADGAITAGLTGTFVYLSLTAPPFKTCTTITGETPNFVHTRAPIQAWVCRGERGE